MKKLELKPFAQIVKDIKAFYAEPCVKQDIKFSLPELGEELTERNILIALKIINDYDGYGHSRKDIIEFNHSNDPSINSYFCKLRKPEMEQFSTILETTESCENGTVILWAGEPMVITNSQGRTCDTTTIDTDCAFHNNFYFGFEGESHYILGKIN